ncbi:hypothetical protein DITRI_Ditri01bG0051800 [Diplodiscus trichospermus]
MPERKRKRKENKNNPVLFYRNLSPPVALCSLFSSNNYLECDFCLIAYATKKIEGVRYLRVEWSSVEI